jgi:hypothetical protein
MCGYRSYRRERYLNRPWDEQPEKWTQTAVVDEHSASEAEREAVLASLRRHAAADRMDVKEFVHRSDVAFAATSRAELYAALNGLPETAAPRATAARRRGPVGPFPVLPLLALLIVIVLIAGHHWFIFPVAWLLFATIRPWGRRRPRAEHPPVTRF